MKNPWDIEDKKNHLLLVVNNQEVDFNVWTAETKSSPTIGPYTSGRKYTYTNGKSVETLVGELVIEFKPISLSILDIRQK